jgi:dienelactone hydrolase
MSRITTFLALCAVACAAFGQAAPDAVLPGTQHLEWPEEDLSGRMMDGAHAFVERKIAEAARAREKHWKPTGDEAGAWQKMVDENRERLRQIIGAVDPRLPPRMERFGDDAHPAVVAETPLYRVYQVRWPVLEGVDGEGLLVEPKNKVSARVVSIPDADQTPEQIMGLATGVPPEQQFARRLAESGCQVVIPTLIDRQPFSTDDPQIQRSGQTNREWLYRQAFHMGRHPIGYEVQKVLAAVDWFAKLPGAEAAPAGAPPIGVAGYAEGGQIALYAAALSPQVKAVLVSGYFNSRDRLWAEPIYRNVWGFAKRFSDAEIVQMILPRHVVIEHAPVPRIEGQKGGWQTPDDESVAAEFTRIARPTGNDGPDLVTADGGKPTGPFSDQALSRFVAFLGFRLADSSQQPGEDRRTKFDPATRQQRAVKQIEQHVQRLLRASEQAREKLFLLKVMPELGEAKWNTEKRLPTRNAERFIEGAKAYREKFATEAMGRFDEPLLAANPRTRKLIESDKWTAYDVVLDVWPEVFAWGVIVIPKDIKPGEKRPVVVCQHGRNGLPRILVDGKETAYNQFAARLAERGFITFAPHNLYRGEDRYRWLCRKANAVECTLFSFIIAQHDQILRWLEQQPFVDGKRLGFYGLSYGGETAVRVPPILEKYCLSICSGDFNQWTTKVAATDQPFSFMRTIEWEMPYWNLGQTFDYAEMAYLMIPRPFMVERGHLDLVGRDAWVAHEYAKVRWLYAQLGLADRTEIEFFQGGHSIHGEGTFRFLHKHLDWPPPKQ